MRDHNDSNSYTITLDTSTGEIQESNSFTVDLNDFNTVEPFTFNTEPFVGCMPSLDRVNNMCKEYPALKKSYDQFKLIYTMTEQDYKGKLKEQGLDDDEIPF